MNVSWLVKFIVFLFLFFFFFVSFLLSFYFFNDAWIEWKLSEKLIQEGIPTQAVVPSCTRRRGNCNTTYRYEVPSSDLKIQTYTMREYGCNCRKGDQITVFYLPDNPSQVRLYTNKYILSLNFGILSFLFDFIKNNSFFNKNIKIVKNVRLYNCYYLFFFSLFLDSYLDSFWTWSSLKKWLK